MNIGTRTGTETVHWDPKLPEPWTEAGLVLVLVLLLFLVPVLTLSWLLSWSGPHSLSCSLPICNKVTDINLEWQIVIFSVKSYNGATVAGICPLYSASYSSCLIVQCSVLLYYTRPQAQTPGTIYFLSAIIFPLLPGPTCAALFIMHCDFTKVLLTFRAGHIPAASMHRPSMWSKLCAACEAGGDLCSSSWNWPRAARGK